MPQFITDDIQTLHKSLTIQATTLLTELTSFHKYLDTLLNTTGPTPLITRPNALLGKFEVDVRREVDHLLRYAEPAIDTHDVMVRQKQGGDGVMRKGEGGDGDGEVDADVAMDLDGIHRIRSSNITFLADVWEGVKRERGVIGVRKGVRYYPVVVPSLGLGDSGTSGWDVAVRQGADGEGMDGTGNGIKGVSKKMNREARERVKQERKIQNQSHTQGSSHSPMNTDTNGHDLRNGTANTTHQTPTHNPANPHSHKNTVTIDIISNHGATWIKAFTKNQRWLTMDLAKEGIVSSPSSSPTENIQPTDNEAMEDLKLIKMAREFTAASRTSRVGRGHRHPRVQFHLPKIERGVSRDVDRVLGYLGRTGVEVVTMEELKGLRLNGHDEGGNGNMKNGMSGSENYEFNLRKTFEQMACPLPPVPLTETLNVDCTILIALVSDVSHARQADIQIPLHYQGAARRDIEVQLQTDVEDPLLPNHIYPILQGRRLICTKKATEHWTNIVRVMGSPTEAERCKIFLGETADDGSQGLTIRERLQKLSVHELPEDLQLPFEVVDFDLDDMSANSGESDCKQVEIDVMRELAKEPRLSSLNSSVFFHGWYKGLTTVSLNRVVSEWLNRAINVILDDLESRAGMTADLAEVMGFCGANVLICGRERSLLGSEK